MRSTVQKVFFAAVISLVPAQYAAAEEIAEIATTEDSELLSMDVQDFFSLYQEVFSVAKKKQKLREAASAIHVLTSEDIVRSGATTIPDVLRLVPGVQVAKISSHKWAVSIRGMNQVLNNKLLVLIDNIPIVTPLFNGVFWEVHNIPLDSIERIEVVRGPGAAVWGSRAVNGVINIITKSADTPQQSKVAAGFGNEHKYSTYVNKNLQIGESSGANLSLKYDQHDNSEGIAGENLFDKWHIASIGLRGDLKINDRNSLKVTNNTFYKEEDFEWEIPVVGAPFNEKRQDTLYHTGSLLSFLWTHEFDNDSEFSAEWSNQFEKREDFSLGYSLYNTDLDLRHRFKPLDGHDFTVGTSFRFYADDTDGSEMLVLAPENRTLEFYRGFFHDEIELIGRELLLTLGARFEQNAQVGFSALPTGRISWSANDWLSFWSAVSYTEGTASRLNDDVRFRAASFPEPTTGLPAIVELTGSRDSESERLTAYEVGVRVETTENFFVDATAYYFKYDNMVSREAGEASVNFDPSSQSPYLVIPIVYSNLYKVDSYGTEISFDWRINQKSKLMLSHSFLYSDVDRGDSTDDVALQFHKNDPRQMATAQFRFDPIENVGFDSILRYVDRLQSRDIDGYTELDLRVSWKPTKDIELSVLGRNLLDSSHREFQDWTFNPPLNEVGRSYFAQVAYSF